MENNKKPETVEELLALHDSHMQMIISNMIPIKQMLDRMLAERLEIKQKLDAIVGILTRDPEFKREFDITYYEIRLLDVLFTITRMENEDNKGDVLESLRKIEQKMKKENPILYEIIKKRYNARMDEINKIPKDTYN